jgi:hypothetical protein
MLQAVPYFPLRLETTVILLEYCKQFSIFINMSLNQCLALSMKIIYVYVRFI